LLTLKLGAPAKNVARKETKNCSYWMRQLEMVLEAGAPATNVYGRKTNNPLLLLDAPATDVAGTDAG
jgi:hypothetical protein